MVALEKLAPLHAGVSVVTEHPIGLVAMSKPAGVLSHPNSAADQDRALLTCRYRMEGEYFEWRSPRAERPPERAWLLNRLDGATSGVVLLARSAELAQAVRDHFRHKQVEKIYAALVFGRPPGSRADWKDRLRVTKRGGQVRTSTDGNVPAHTRATLVQSGMGPEGVVSLLQLEPRTGRSHQLRVQCAHRRLPIVGDATYGDFKRNRAFVKQGGEDRLFLHSFRTSFQIAWQGKQHRFRAEASLPAAFNAALTS